MARNRLAQFVAKCVPFGVFGDARRMERHAESLQRNRLKTLLRQAAGTEWGRAHGYEELLRTPDIVRAYQQRVPLQNYADLQPLIQRVRNGEPNVLWPGRFKYFGVSGGTYSTGKVVPAGEDMLAQTFRAGAAMTIRYLAQTGNLDALTGAIIPLTGRLFKSDEQPGAVLGNFSGLMTQRHLAQLAAKSKKPHSWFPDTTETLYQEDWEQKLNRMADVTMQSDVRYIALIPTWGLIFFRKVIERYNARHGASATCVRDIWPKLQLVVSGGVALAPYRQMICDLIGRAPIDLLETYGAMEAGVIAFQSSMDDGALLLNTGGSFFEFIRYADRDQTNPERFWVGSIEPGQRYIPVISNANGLWAYVLGDVVEFTETRPPKLKVLGRTSEILNQFRESLDGDAARKALTNVTQQCGATVVEFHVTYSPADTISMPCHEWYIEFDRLPADLQRLSEMLDGDLRKTCAPYDKVRRNSGLAPPRIVAVPTGGLHKALERMGRVLDAQAKVPCMTEGRQLAAAIGSETYTPTPVAAS